MAGKDYSTTPLGKKLGAKPGLEVLVFSRARGQDVRSAPRTRFS